MDFQVGMIKQLLSSEDIRNKLFNTIKVEINNSNKIKEILKQLKKDIHEGSQHSALEKIKQIEKLLK